MARWLERLASSAEGSLVPESQSWMVLLSTLIVFYICVSMLLALCAVRSSPRVDDLHASCARDRPDGELGVESRKLSHRFSSSTAAISKLGASFRISSFRDPPSFRISSFGTDCRSQVGVIDALRRSRAVVEEINTEPAVWQRAILRGERCAPLSFSGLILYDEHGNPLPSTTTSEQDSLKNQQALEPASNQENLIDK